MYIDVKGVRRTYLQAEHKMFSSVWYEDLEALACIDLGIDKGEFVSIVGPSGCGKTTLLDVLGGLQEPSDGAVVINNQELKGPRKGTAMVFQQVGLLPWRTVTENVLFGIQLKKKARLTQEDQDVAAEQIEMVGLEAFRDAYPRQLSGGMQQRVGIARALATKPDVLLMDEPFGALDAQTRLVLQNQLLQLLDKVSTTVIFITHDVDEAVFLSNRVAIMEPRPSRIGNVLDVNLPHPRWEHNVRATPEFYELRATILRHLGLPE
jgi:NitT/TauT family transport system ATP-binding protein